MWPSGGNEEGKGRVRTEREGREYGLTESLTRTSPTQGAHKSPKNKFSYFFQPTRQISLTN